MALSWDDRLFYAEIAGGPAAAGVGPFMMWDWNHPIIGASLIVFGIGAFVHALLPTDPNKRADLNRRRFLVTLSAIMFAWIAVAYDLYLHHIADTSSPIPNWEEAVEQWGALSANDPNCNVILDGSRLMRLASTYDVALVCGVIDATMDKFNDKRIAVSGLFSIHPAAIPISALRTDEMTQAIQKQISDAARITPKTTVIEVPIRTWYEIALLPTGTDVTDIHRMSDVARYKGIILPKLNHNEQN